MTPVSDNKILALKRLYAALKNDGTAADSVSGDTVVEIIDKITAHLKGEDVLKTLTVTSAPGTANGTTKITVDGAETTNFRYALGSAASIPEYLTDLSEWATWDGVSDITADDGTQICICEVNSEVQATAAGTTSVNTNVG